MGLPSHQRSRLAFRVDRFAVLTLTLVAACAGDAPEHGLRTEISTLSGFPVVTNRGEPPVWALEETLALGGREAVRVYRIHEPGP